MALRLIAGGHDVTVYNRTADRTAGAQEAGAQVAQSPREAALGAQAVITMVANDEALRGVAEGEDGLLRAISTSITVLQMSTVGPDTTAWLAGEVRTRGGRILDCPVLGSRAEAADGNLWILAGGDEETIADMRPILDRLSQQVYHMGEIGQGTRAKLCFNLVGGGVVAALAEGIALIEAAGIDSQLYVQIVKDSRLPERLWIGKATQMVARDFEPRFSLANITKDLNLAVLMGKTYGLDLQQGQASRATLLRGAAVVGGDRDMAAAVAGVRPAEGTRQV
jgi:3-hydroxyisobutyrate dehydrogenase-like beta-hydroxyacid dehydrogenase